MRILVTGGCGFIGSHFIRNTLLRDPRVEILNVDCLSYAANDLTRQELEALAKTRYRHINLDICSSEVSRVFRDFQPNVLVNFAGETHVDRSLRDSKPFFLSNVVGVHNLLMAASGISGLRFLQISTDEVYGESGDGESEFTEERALRPSSPYAVSKAAADHLVLTSGRVLGVDTRIVRSSNNFGPYQCPEKFIPLVISHALRDFSIPIYGDGLQQRDWLFVEDHCDAIEKVISHGKPSHIYNVASEKLRTNLQLANAILTALGKPASLLEFVQDRLGHDRCYRINASKVRNQLSWSQRIPFDEGLNRTIHWYKTRPDWIAQFENIEDESFGLISNTRWEKRSCLN